MRILLDECIDEAMRHHFPGHVCQTCRYAGFKGLTNGQLITEAEQAGFQVLITVDQNLAYQQRVGNRAISVIVLRGRTTDIDDLLVLVPEVLLALDAVEAGQLIRIGT